MYHGIESFLHHMFLNKNINLFISKISTSVKVILLRLFRIMIRASHIILDDIQYAFQIKRRRHFCPNSEWLMKMHLGMMQRKTITNTQFTLFMNNIYKRISVNKWFHTCLLSLLQHVNICIIKSVQSSTCISVNKS